MVGEVGGQEGAVHVLRAACPVRVRLPVYGNLKQQCQKNLFDLHIFSRTELSALCYCEQSSQKRPFAKTSFLKSVNYMGTINVPLLGHIAFARDGSHCI